MKKLYLSLFIVYFTLISFGQVTDQSKTDQLFNQAKNDYRYIMVYPHDQVCEFYLNKYKEIPGLDSLRVQVLNDFLKDVNEIYENTDWHDLKVTYVVSKEIAAKRPKSPDLPSNATQEMWKTYNKQVEEYKTLLQNYELQNTYPKNIIKVFQFNKRIKKAYDYILSANNPNGWLAFRDTFNLYRNIILRERDSLINIKELYFNPDYKQDYYLDWIGFKPSLDLYENVKKSIKEAAKPLLLKELKSDTTGMRLSDISEFSTPFMEFNKFSKQNHVEYLKLRLTLEKGNILDYILMIFDLSQTYTTPLQKENFKNSTEYANLIAKKDSMRSAALSNIYMIDLKPTKVEGELDLGGLFLISNYNMGKKGFTLNFNPYSLPGNSFNDYFSTIVPKAINRICFESIPFITVEEKVSSLTTLKGSITTGNGYNMLFIPTNMKIGGKIEDAGDTLRIKVLFKLDEDVKSSNDDNIIDYVKASDSKLIIYNSETAEILFSKLYKKQLSVKTQNPETKSVTPVNKSTTPTTKTTNAPVKK
jgi:hypothetical protein